MADRRSSSRRFRPSGVGNYTAASCHPFTERFFDELDRRLAREEAPLAHVNLTVRLGDQDQFCAVVRTLHFPPAKA